MYSVIWQKHCLFELVVVKNKTTDYETIFPYWCECGRFPPFSGIQSEYFFKFLFI